MSDDHDIIEAVVNAVASVRNESGEQIELKITEKLEAKVSDIWTELHRIDKTTVETKKMIEELQKSNELRIQAFNVMSEKQNQTEKKVDRHQIFFYLMGLAIASPWFLEFMKFVQQKPQSIP